MLNRHYIGMTDDQLGNEHMAQEIISFAMDAFCAACRKVNELSTTTKIDADAVAAFFHDEMPDMRQWDEAISEARRP